MSRSIYAFACFLLASVAGAFSLDAKAVVLQWYDGAANFQIGQDYACLSDPPILETRVAGYSGYTYWPPYQPVTIPFAQLPAVGEVFYVKLVLSHPGNPCAGSAVGIEMLLPSGVTTAVSAANPAFCFARVPPNQQHADYKLINLGNDSGYGCPQTYQQGLQGLAILAPNGGLGGGSWGMFAGSWLEFLIPLKSSAAQNGANQIYFRINPDIGVVGYTNQLLYVNADTLFRASMEDTNLTLDLCALGPTTNC
jgi:hypothetical protein